MPATVPILAAMSTPPRISVVIPCFNAESYLRSSVESALRQRVPVEVVIVDDASTDASLACARAIAADHPEVRVLAQPTNQGAFAARRRGVATATAPYIHFLDADDEVPPNSFANALAILDAARDADILFGTADYAPDGESPTTATLRRHRQDYGPPVSSELFGHDIFRLPHLGRLSTGLISTKIFARELLSRAFDLFPDGHRTPNMDDLPLIYAALFLARHFLPAPDLSLCTYHVGRGRSKTAAQRWSDGRFLGRFNVFSIFPRLAAADPARAADVEAVRATHLQNCAIAVANALPRVAPDDLPALLERIYAAAPDGFPALLQLHSSLKLADARQALVRLRTSKRYRLVSALARLLGKD